MIFGAFSYSVLVVGRLIITATTIIITTTKPTNIEGHREELRSVP